MNKALLQRKRLVSNEHCKQLTVSTGTEPLEQQAILGRKAYNVSIVP